MEKYLVFRLEKPHRTSVWSGDEDKIVSSMVKQSCFELIKEFDSVTEVYKKDNIRAAESYARSYSKDNGLRTLVIKGSVFGN